MAYINLKRLLISFKQFLGQITKDAMLFLICTAPFLFGFFIRFGIPFAEKLLTEYYNNAAVLFPYYLIFDLLLAVLTPMMYGFVSAMVILGDIDDGITNYVSVTPLGKNGYLYSKLGFPVIISLFITILVLLVFSLTKLTLGLVIGLTMLTCILGFIMSIMVITISTNKVEGMAVMKLSGILAIGIPAPFFISGNLQYLLFFFPSLWIAKFAISNEIVYFLISIITSFIWILVLLKRFKGKIIV